MRIYRDEKPDIMGGILEWAEHAYFKLERPYRVHNLYHSPSWLDRYLGEHPPEVMAMMDDVLSGRASQVARGNDDVEHPGALVVSAWTQGPDDRRLCRPGAACGQALYRRFASVPSSQVKVGSGIRVTIPLYSPGGDIKL